MLWCNYCDTTYIGIVPPESAERSEKSYGIKHHNASRTLSQSRTDTLQRTYEVGGQVAKKICNPAPLRGLEGFLMPS